MKKIMLLGGALSALMLSGCGNSGVQVNDPTRDANQNRGVKRPTSNQKMEPKEIQSITDAHNAFGIQFFQQTLADSRGGNLFLSPISASFALEMTYNGAAGETKTAMGNALKVGSLPLAQLNGANAQLSQSLTQPGPGVLLTISNSVWLGKGYEFKPDFVARNQQFYGAETRNIDFTEPNAHDVINAWVARSTNDMIKDLLSPLPNDTSMVLVNAIYFKGQWKEPFDPKNTQSMPFKSADGSASTVQMMSQGGEFLHLREDDFQAVSLEYGEGRMRMDLFLPEEGVALGDFLKRLNAENWKSWTSSFRMGPGRVQIPKFKMEFEKELNDILKAMGMGIAFDPNRADFSGMSSKPFYIGKVKQKAVIEVNEEGSEAAAATSVEMRATAAPIDEPFVFKADRPFFFAIRDTQTGAILFMGTFNRPADQN